MLKKKAKKYYQQKTNQIVIQITPKQQSQENEKNNQSTKVIMSTNEQVQEALGWERITPESGEEGINRMRLILNEQSNQITDG